jgi:hypothetical protein
MVVVKFQESSRGVGGLQGFQGGRREMGLRVEGVALTDKDSLISKEMQREITQSNPRRAASLYRDFNKVKLFFDLC